MPRKVDLNEPAVQFSTIKIRVPDHMIKVTSKGHLSINVPTLTKKGNPSKRGDEKSIQLEGAKILVPEIESQGRILLPDEARSMAKSIRKTAPRKPRKPKTIEPPPATDKESSTEEESILPPRQRAPRKKSSPPEPDEDTSTIFSRTRSKTKKT